MSPIVLATITLALTGQAPGQGQTAVEKAAERLDFMKDSVSGPEWQYALAPMTVYALKGTYRGKAVWELPDRQPCWDPSKLFYDCAYRP